jgi:predicted nucleic acid-binding protein
LQEILQEADSAERFETWRKVFADLFCYVPRDPVESHFAAARLCQDCRKAGKTPRSSNDCLIAQIAIEYGLTLLHSDGDFNAIARVIGQLRLYPAD